MHVRRSIYRVTLDNRSESNNRKSNKKSQINMRKRRNFVKFPEMYQTEG